MTSQLITLRLPPCISWMVADIADVEVEPFSDPAWVEMHEACQAPITAGEPAVLAMSADAWVEMIDELEFLNEREIFFDRAEDLKKFKAALRVERREIGKIVKALGR